MKWIVVIDCLAVNGFAKEAVFSGKSALQLNEERVKEAVGATDLLRLVRKNSNLPSTLPTKEVEVVDGASYLQALEEASDGYNHILRICADQPFISPQLIQEVMKEHIQTAADYTYGEGFPAGLCPEALQRDLLPILAGLNPQTPPPSGSLFPYFEKQINDYDISVVIAKKDSRRLRLKLNTQSKRRLQLCQKLYQCAKGEVNEEFINQHEELLFTAPAYYPIQIVSGVTQRASYQPEEYPLWKPDSPQMSPESLQQILEKAKEFSGEFHLSLSFHCDPVSHSQITKMIETALASAAQTVLIETAGIGWNLEEVHRLTTLGEGRLKWILLLDSCTQESYQQLRGEGFQEAQEFALEMVQRFPQWVYVQALRLKDKEKVIDEFYRFWSEKKAQIIVEKHNHYCGLIESQKAVDLSPVLRYPCWHLKRELPILVNGEVALCLQDLKNDASSLNALTHPWQEIWERVEQRYKNHVQGQYEGLCGGCDEYYTFHF